MGRPFQRHNRTFKITAAVLVAGFLAPCATWSQSGHQASLHSNKPATPATAHPSPSDFLEEELKALTTYFGASPNNIPTDFVEKVRRWAHLYQTRDRDEMERVLGPKHKEFEAVRQQVAGAKLPSELAFVTLVESHFQTRISHDGNTGLWQFTRDTARRNGLKVNAQVDERMDPRKSTEAACHYLLLLRRHLGPDSSLLLALAAYNMGPGRLKQRMNQVRDPSQRHDFWYLYRVRVLPALTRSHIARVMAAILIGRHPEHFGFKTTTSSNLETASSTRDPIPTAVSR
ncbi:MAG: hypothetical protein DMG06_21240 [Acidobacteria bacterium]|nr:MAG: hypothetical protein DMG06_21240 [Acidobacteriota bacterium]